MLTNSVEDNLFLANIFLKLAALPCLDPAFAMFHNTLFGLGAGSHKVAAAGAVVSAILALRAKIKGLENTEGNFCKELAKHKKNPLRFPKEITITAAASGSSVDSAAKFKALLDVCVVFCDTIAQKIIECGNF